MEKWDRKVHVVSSLQPKDDQYALFIGRWQPLHDGHKQLFEQALNAGKRVCIAIRDIAPDEKNPFTAEEVKHNILNHYSQEYIDGKIRVIVIPDICSVEFGRGVGYNIIEHIPPTQVGEISATKIREQMRKEGKL
jgi:cytidyltransferase-like protein